MKRLLLGVLLLAAGCGGGGLNHGKIVGKHIDPPYTSTVIVPIYAGCVGGTNGSACTPIFTYIPFIESHGTAYVLDLKSGHKTGDVDVDPETYSRAKLGQYFNGKTVKVRITRHRKGEAPN